MLAQQSYLLVTEDDFAKASGAKSIIVEGLSLGGVGRVPGNGQSYPISNFFTLCIKRC